MFLRQVDLTTALRPTLDDDETLLFVVEKVGLYEGNVKIANYQHGSVYLTSHRVCYVDNEDARSYSVAVELKEIERTEFYPGFLKSSPKVTLFPKPIRRSTQAIRSPTPRYGSASDALINPQRDSSRSVRQAPAQTREVNATWVCPICGLSNSVPSNFDPATSTEHTPLPACLACGIKPPLVLMVKAAISALSRRAHGTASFAEPPSADATRRQPMGNGNMFAPTAAPASDTLNVCPRCTFENHRSLTFCEICGAPLQLSLDAQYHDTTLRPPESPGPAMKGSIIGDETIETIKFSFRSGGGVEKVFLERLNGALVQKKWLLYSAPPVPRPISSSTPKQDSPWSTPNGTPRTSTPQQRIIGIAGLERRETEIRENNKTVISSAFEDLDALMTSAKEVIAMAEQFAKQTDQGSNAERAQAQSVLSDSAAALGLVTTRDMLSSGSASNTLYITELARNLAEFLTDDKRGVLRREGGIMSLVDLWSVFNRTRNGIELISPLDFEKAATLWESLHLPIRLRRFRSGLLVVQEKSRTDEKTIGSLLRWLRAPQHALTPLGDDLIGMSFGRGVTAHETAERFGWSVGVATEELEMAEDLGALCRDQCIDGIRFWENHFLSAGNEPSTSHYDALQSMRGLSL